MENNCYVISDIKFPIITFDRHGNMSFARKEKEIDVCSAFAFKQGFYKDLQIIDSNGFLYHVKDAKKIGTVGIFWGYNIFLCQKLKVELLIADRSGTPITLDVLRSRITNALNTKDPHWDMEEMLQKKILSAESYNEIIGKLNDEFYRIYKV